MVMDLKLVALIASEIKLSEPVAIYAFQGINVKIDLHTGEVTIPDEQRVGATLVSYSKEIQHSYRAPVEAALVMKMQLELLKSLSTIDNPELQKFLSPYQPILESPTPNDVKATLDKLVSWVSPPIMNMVTFFQSVPHRQSPMKAALYQAFQYHDVSNLKSLTTLQAIQESIENALNTTTLRLD